LGGEIVADRFEIERLAGRGGMGTVHRARDRKTGATIALKIVEGVHANARFEREASLLARLSDPGIVKYVAHGQLAPARMYLAMEWLEGTALDEVLAREPLALRDAVAVVARIARALAASHALGVVHRDVKPANIVLRGGRPDDAVLVDFGIARLADASRAMTATGAVIGTPAYMAPEQVRGARELDARVDVFALGCVLFECLAGRPPFAGHDVVAVLAKILLEPAPRLSTLRREVPAALDDLVANMLQKQPEARPPAIGRIATWLDELGTDSLAVID
jgi:serine/threonine protein kinase